MDTRRKKAVKPTNQAPKAKRPVFRDMTHFARPHKLPSQLGFSPLPVVEVSNDIRAILGLPPLAPDLAVKDGLLTFGKEKGLSAEFVAKLNSKDSPYYPEVSISKEDEPPSTISALESYVFEDELLGNEDVLDISVPSRSMSGWVAARVISESPASSVIVDHIPLGGNLQLPLVAAHGPYPSGIAPSGTTKTVKGSNPGLRAESSYCNIPKSSFGCLLPASVRLKSARDMGVTFGWPRGAGAAIGMGPVRLQLSLAERLSVLEARKEERDRRFIQLRRYYLQVLKSYALESQEMNNTLELLRGEAATARAAVRPKRPENFVTDAEEWFAVDRLAASSRAVWEQNKVLRSRLAELTNRVSGNKTCGDTYSLEHISSDGVTVGGGASLSTTSDRSTASSDVSDELTMMGDAPYEVPVSNRPRTMSKEVLSTGRGAVLAFGDLVATPYGRAVVISQSDIADKGVELLFKWGSTGTLQLDHVILLAVAGEEYLATEASDFEYMKVSIEDAHKNAIIPPTLPEGTTIETIKAKMAALIASHESCLSASNNGGVGGYGGSSSTEVQEDQENESAIAQQVLKKLKPKRDNGSGSRARQNVYSSGYDRNGIPRGVPLRIDHARGVGSLGYVVSTLNDSITFSGDGTGPKYHDIPLPSPKSSVAVKKEAVEPEVSGSPITPPSSDNVVITNTTDQLRLALAEKERLLYQLRVADESRKDQRRRLTDSRLAMSRLLETLNAERLQVSSLSEDIAEKDAQISELAKRLLDHAIKFDPTGELAKLDVSAILSSLVTSGRASTASVIASTSSASVLSPHSPRSESTSRTPHSARKTPHGGAGANPAPGSAGFRNSLFQTTILESDSENEGEGDNPDGEDAVNENADDENVDAEENGYENGEDNEETLDEEGLNVEGSDPDGDAAAALLGGMGGGNVGEADESDENADIAGALLRGKRGRLDEEADEDDNTADPDERNDGEQDYSITKSKLLAGFAGKQVRVFVKMRQKDGSVTSIEAPKTVTF